ncbi:hypothetical protein TrLO_g8538 [Triparma laevis f. longispina]|uniref:Uncharacterized protein n=1 Tax=Triparma laevis f. longispina TaxID=1714387 RepID=A0A9W7CB67_9STRA|nr:hypothetical protein TrLO_g8538 [Triparma laevis f. longispina]
MLRFLALLCLLALTTGFHVPVTVLNRPSAFPSTPTSTTSFRTSFRTSSTTLNESPFDQITSFFAPTPIQAESEYEDVIVPPSPALGFAFLLPSLLLSFISFLPSLPLLLFSLFLLLQTTRIRFVFDQTSFSLQNAKPFSNELESSGENFVVGGENRWSYDSFVNYEFFPAAFPILVYFKETQTPDDKWAEGPGQLDKVGGGQLHFFPAIADVKVLKEEFEKRGCNKL